MSRVVTLAAMLALSACAARPVTTTGNRSAASSRGAGDTGVAAARAPTADATAALLDRSRVERATGDLGAAAATVERALSIAPDDALLWVELAEIRQDQGDRELAAEMARKALTLTSDDSAVATRARRLLTR